MTSLFVDLDVAGVRTFLDAADPQVRKEGERLFRAGKTSLLDSSTPGCLRFRIEGDPSVEVVWSRDGNSDWTAVCDVHKEQDCSHVYAAGKALLAEHSHALVQNLSSRAAAAVVPDTNSGGLEASVRASLGRALTRKEKEFVREIADLFKTSKGLGEISTLELRRLGFQQVSLFDYRVRIAPFPVKSDIEFWQCLAFMAEAKGVKLPAFIVEVTDLSGVRAKHARWKDAQEIRTWRSQLAEAVQTVEIPAASRQWQVSFRMKIRPESAILEWRRDPDAPFTALRRHDFETFAKEYNLGGVDFSEGAEPLWISYLHHFETANSMELFYRNGVDSTILNRLLRNPKVLANTVADSGQLLHRAAEPLLWRLKSPSPSEKFYNLYISTGDGTELPPVLKVFDGLPTLYLTPVSLYTGPARARRVLDVVRPNLIPRGALESGEGLTLLAKLQVPLPVHLQEKLIVEPVHVTLRCRLIPSNSFHSFETCLVVATARSGDGRVQEYFAGNAWCGSEDVDALLEDADSEEGGIKSYDRTRMDWIPAVMQRLEATYDSARRGYSMRVKKDFASGFAAWIATIPKGIEVVLEGELATISQGVVKAKIDLEVTEGDLDWFDLRVVLRAEETQLTKEELRLLLNAKGKFVRLEGKGWRRLDLDISEADNDCLARLGLSEGEFDTEVQRLHVLQLADPAARRFLPESTVQTIQRRAGELKARVMPALPEGLKASLRPYQLEGYHFLAYLAENRFGGILADDMGLGKTLQTLAFLLWLHAKVVAAGKKPAPFLVVCPKSVMENWRAESGKFAPNLRVRIWSQSELVDLGSKVNDADLHVINYSHLRVLGEAVESVRWLAVVLDEAQYIKNPSSQTAQSARALNAENRLVLTGTPIENRLLDLWSLMAFAMPGMLGSRMQFGKLYDRVNDPLARQRLAARVRPFLLRRTKSQVARDLPERTEEDIVCELDGEQATLYRAELKRAQQMLLKIKTQKQLAKEQFHFLASLIRLRQICCSPRLVSADSKESGAKLEALLDQLEPLMEEGHKVLVFSQFVEMLELIRAAIQARKWPLYYLTGSTDNRGELVDQFQSHPGSAVFLISLKAGGFGLNLTAASYVVLFDPWWNPAVENQAIDRTHRIGQVNNVIAYRLLIKGSVEEKIRMLQKRKSQLVEDVLGEEKFAKGLTLDDLSFLFSDS